MHIDQFQTQAFSSFHRIPRNGFYEILDKISPDITKTRTNWREPISSKEKLALTLRYVACIICSNVFDININTYSDMNVVFDHTKLLRRFGIDNCNKQMHAGYWNDMTRASN